MHYKPLDIHYRVVSRKQVDCFDTVLVAVQSDYALGAGGVVTGNIHCGGSAVAWAGHFPANIHQLRDTNCNSDAHTDYYKHSNHYTHLYYYAHRHSGCTVL